MAEDYYNERADWSLIPQRMREGVRLYVMNGVPMDGFGTAIFENDFMTAIGKADEDNRRAIVGWATFVYNYTPHACHGSPEKVSAWLDEGGILGRQDAA